MSDLRVASLKGRKPGSAPSLPDGAVVSGVTTSANFSGNVTGNVTGTATGKVTGNVTGNITGTAGTFSGNVSVGGVVTYEDVTSIDSVGVVTARAGIRIGAGQSVSAVSGIVTYYGDGSKLSGVESGVVNFVASGTIPNGKTVVVNTDGTVSTITQTTSGPSVGSEVVFNTDSVAYTGATFDSNSNKVVIVYYDGNDNYGKAIVGTVSGTSISFGSEVSFASATTYFSAITFDSNSNKVVIAYRDADNNNYGTAIVGTVSGTSISFGSEVVFNTGNITADIPVIFDSNSNKVVISYRDNGNGNKGTTIIGTVSGTGISFGSEVVFNNGDTSNISSAYDSANQKVVIAYRDNANSGSGTAIVGTVSGTSISFGSEVVFNSASTSYNSVIYDSTNQKVVIAFSDNGNGGGYGTTIVGTVSGTSISFGSEVVFNSAITNYISAVYNSTDNKVVVAYSDDGNSNYGTAITGTVSGTSISFGSEVVFNSGNTNYVGSTFDSTNGKVVISYNDIGNGNKGTAVVYSSLTSSTNLTAENYIGMSAEAIANGATGRINVLTGTNTGQTGLTTAQKYFVQPNGTLGTSPGSPSVVAGTAISGTKIVVR